MLYRCIGGLFFCLLVPFISSTNTLALDKKASFALSHYIMAVIYEDRGDIDRAIQEYKQALKTDYQSQAIRLNLASDYIKKNEFERAKGELNSIIKLAPDTVEAHAILALLYSAQNKTQEASQHYETALRNASKVRPQDVNIYKSLGEICLEQRKFKEAQAAYKMILGLAPNDAQAHFYLGSIYFELKDSSKAEEELRKAVGLEADYHEALNYLGYMYVEENRNLDEAEKMIRRAIELQPAQGAYVDSLGWLYFKRGKYREAVKELEKAKSLLDDPVIYDHLGDAYLKIGDAENAKANWAKSLKLEPNQDSVKRKIEGFKK